MYGISNSEIKASQDFARSNLGYTQDIDMGYLVNS